MKIDRRLLCVAIGLALGLAPEQSSAQFGYPGGYGNYGWGGWGADPHSGYMAGLGAYAKGRGAYELDKAQADAINVKTIIEWNKALQARKRTLRLEKEKEDAKLHAEGVVRTREANIENGTTLNSLLEDLLEFNAGRTEAYLSKVPLSSRLLREIPFEPATESVTICINQLVANEAVPRLLQDDRYADVREKLNQAVKAALQEDVKGTVSEKTQKTLTDAVAAFQKKFQMLDQGGDVSSLDADEYLRTVASLSRLLKDTHMREAIALLDTYEKGSVGDLIAFMEIYNLRFAPAVSPQQKELYRNLVPLLGDVRKKVAKDEAISTSDPEGKSLQTAARKVFHGMTWKQLEAQAKDSN